MSINITFINFTKFNNKRKTRILYFYQIVHFPYNLGTSVFNDR